MTLSSISKSMTEYVSRILEKGNFVEVTVYQPPHTFLPFPLIVCFYWNSKNSVVQFNRTYDMKNSWTWVKSSVVHGFRPALPENGFYEDHTMLIVILSTLWHLLFQSWVHWFGWRCSSDDPYTPGLSQVCYSWGSYEGLSSIPHLLTPENPGTVFPNR